MEHSGLTHYYFHNSHQQRCWARPHIKPFAIQHIRRMYYEKRSRELEKRVTTSGTKINNRQYFDDTTLIAASKEEL